MAKPKRIDTDVVIVGSGGAGMAAAVEARSAGARVAVLEQAETLGGAAIISGGGCCIAGTPLQESLGIRDNPDQAFEDWVQWGKGSADEQWARFYLEHSLHDLYFWAEGLGVKWVDMKFQEGNRVQRWHRPANNGLGLTMAIINAAQARGVTDILTSTPADKIIMNNGTVSGVSAINVKSGDPVQLTSKTVVIASGGFNSNLDMIREVRQDLKNFKLMEGSGVGSKGIGHKLVREIGGYLTHRDHIWFYVYATPDYRDPQERRGLVFRMIPGYIWVNQQGRRFHNEAKSGGNSASPALMAQTPRHSWAIVDTPMKANLEIADPYYRVGDKVNRAKVEELLENSPFVKKADTLAGLAEEIGVDVPTFVDTVERYNTACEQGLEEEPEFAKPLALSKPFDTPPYFAIQFFLLARKNFGGIKTDIGCRVLDKHFEPIQGLYAAGEACGMAGGHINGRAGLEGTMLGPSIFSGRVAGGWAAREAGHGDGFV
ncbi:MAG: FAD-dependent oxidoreductase, partial [Deltaproteobacteria bacterium]|nr:FAD-dependent oxidoreductase [Deltaproteobacteria bacterium]